MKNCALNEVVANTTRMLERIVGEDIHMRVEFAPVQLSILADEGMLDQILLNLAVNARDAMPAGGRLLMTTAAADLDETTAARTPAARPGSFACLTVTDSGNGIPAAILPRIFEPFFTTKDVGHGTGLGLATVYGIVQQHHGFIEVESEVGRGTTFRIWLPQVPRQAEPSPPSVAPGVRGGNETIFVVEDEPALRLLVRNILTWLGYRVIEAASGRAALELWPVHRNAVHLLVTDLVMPDGLNGRDLANRLHADQPQLKVLFTSGYSAEIAGPDFPLTEGVNFLAKPYRPDRLAEMVRFRLDS